uniref:hypothetical protein n=1 Tax=Gordonia sp. B7-2 TaxID=3420932 RepID=UPI003D8BBFE6
MAADLGYHEGWRAIAVGTGAAADLAEVAELRERARATVHGSRDRELCDRRRISVHARIAPVMTCQIVQTHELLARHFGGPEGVAVIGHASAAVSGSDHIDRRTAVHEYALSVARNEFERAGLKIAGTRAERVPVCWVTYQGHAGPGATAHAVLRFYGHPGMHERGQLRATLAQQIEYVVKQCETRLVVVDDVTAVSDGRSIPRSPSLSILAALPVALILVGDGIGTSCDAMVSGIRNRWLKASVSPIPYGNGRAARSWCNLVAHYEARLTLAEVVDGCLTEHAAWLHWRTGGSPSVLDELLTRAAAAAIRSGAETITLPLLRSIPLRIDAPTDGGGDS